MIHKHKPEAEDAKRRAKWIYWTSYSATFLPLLALWLGHAAPGGGGFFFFCLAAMLAGQIATWAVRRAGVSQEGLRSETIERDPRAALVPFLGKPPEFKSGEFWARGTRVDREGIEARDMMGGKRKRVLWRDVESCTFAAPLNAAGDYSHAGFVLQGSDKLPLLVMSSTQRDADKLLPAIRFYLRGEEPEQDAHRGC